MTKFDRPEAGEWPTSLVATTVKVYEVPLDRPLTVAETEEPDTVALWPEEEVTV